MISLDVRINQAVKFPFLIGAGTTGMVAFSVTTLRNGEVYPGLTFTFDEIGGGVYTAEVTFTEIGRYSIIIEDDISANINAVNKDIYTILNDLDDVAQGSWIYNKANGTLTLKRQNGTDLASFDVVDNETVSSRERQ